MSFESNRRSAMPNAKELQDAMDKFELEVHQIETCPTCNKSLSGYRTQPYFRYRLGMLEARCRGCHSIIKSMPIIEGDN